MNTEKYIVRLSDKERQRQAAIVQKLKGTSQKVKRAIVLLKADADGPNWTNEKISELTGLGFKAISNIRKQLVLEGFEVALNRKKRRLPPVSKKLDGLHEAQIIATRCGSPPDGPIAENSGDSGRCDSLPTKSLFWKSSIRSAMKQYEKH